MTTLNSESVGATGAATVFPPIRVRRTLRMRVLPYNSAKEEFANTLTHAIGAAAAAIAVGVLLYLSVRHSGWKHVIPFAAYGGSLLLVYIASTGYHAARDPGVKNFFRALDHASIYALIAGSYTPFMVVLLGGKVGWSFIPALWGLAIIGSFCKWIFLDRFELLFTALYLVMAWGAYAYVSPLAAHVPVGCMEWVVAGGLLYSIGVVFFLWEKLPFNHAIWHVFVIAGSACHFAAIILYVLPK